MADKSIFRRELLAITLVFAIIALGVRGGWLLWHHATGSTTIGIFSLLLMSGLLGSLAYLGRTWPKTSKA